jgi:L-fuconolactonase
MEIIDAQIHPMRPTKDWSGSFSRPQKIEASVELSVAAMDAVGVDAAVVNWPSLDYLSAYISRFPDRFAGVPFAGPAVRSEGSVDDYLDDLCAMPGIVGIRFVVSSLDIPDSRLVDQFHNGDYEPYFEAAERHKLPAFVLMCGGLPNLHETLRAHPNLDVIIDHFGLCLPPIGTSAFPDIWPHLHRMIDAFGVDRLMWGSDFTHGQPLRNYRESVDFLLLSDEISETDKEALLAGTVRRCLNWPSS